MIPFNRPAIVGTEMEYLSELLNGRQMSGDGAFTKKCHHLLENRFDCPKTLLTTSCTHALEMSAILAHIQEGDEVIMPSFTFVSTANAFVLRGAKVKFVDIRPDTLNLDERLIEQAITPRTKVIIPVHYAGVPCEMDAIMALAEHYGLMVVEDAAQAVMSTYKGKFAGTIGHLGCFSFHDSKNIQCGEGGALLVNQLDYLNRAEIIREKGTDRTKFLRGQVDKYTWIDIGSSYLPSEVVAAFLYAQLETMDTITENRLRTWRQYQHELQSLEQANIISTPKIPSGILHNGHIFYILTKDAAERNHLMQYLKEQGVHATSHYVPLHSSSMGRAWGEFVGEDRYTTSISERLLRLPIFYGMTEDEVGAVCHHVKTFYGWRD